MNWHCFEIIAEKQRKQEDAKLNPAVPNLMTKRMRLALAMDAPVIPAGRAVMSN
jgi:hypothetical protein